MNRKGENGSCKNNKKLRHERKRTKKEDAGTVALTHTHTHTLTCSHNKFAKSVNGKTKVQRGDFITAH